MPTNIVLNNGKPIASTGDADTGINGTNASSFTVNEDASTATTEDASLSLKSADGTATSTATITHTKSTDSIDLNKGLVLGGNFDLNGNFIKDTSLASSLSLSEPPIHQFLFNEASFTSGAKDTGKRPLNLDSVTGTPISEAGFSGMGQEKSVRFDGASHLAVSGTFPKRFENDLSIAALIKLNSGTGDHAVVTLQAGSAGAVDSAFVLRYRSSTGTMDGVVYRYDGVTTSYASSEATGPVVGTWHWVFMTYERSTGIVTTRVDDGAGTKTDTGTLAAGSQLNQLADTVLRVGVGGANIWRANMNIHSLYIWDRLIPTADIDAIYASGGQNIEDLVADHVSKAGKESFIYAEGSDKYISTRIWPDDLDRVDLKELAEGYILRSDGEKLVAVEDQPLAEVELSDITPPSPPGSGKGSLYKITGNRNLFWKPNAEISGQKVTNQSTLDILSRVATPIVSARPAHLFKFNETSFGTAFDSGTGSALDLDTTGGTLDSTDGFPGFGEPSSAISFKTSTSFIESSGTYPDITGDFSIAALARLTSAALGNDHIAFLGEISGQEVFNLKLDGSGRVTGAIFGNTSHGIIFTTGTVDQQLTTNQWHWCFLTYEVATGTLTVQVDDNAAATASFGSPPENVYIPTPGQNLVVGNSKEHNQYFPGEIDVIAFYNGLLTATDISNIVASGNQEQEDLVKTSPNDLSANQSLLYDTEASSFVNRSITHSDISGNGSATIQTTDVNQTTIATIAVPTDGVILIEARVVAKNGTTETNGYKLYAHCDNTSGTASVVNVTQDYGSEEAAAWDATVTASGGNALIRVTGEAAKTVDWKVDYTVTSLS